VTQNDQGKSPGLSEWLQELKDRSKNARMFYEEISKIKIAKKKNIWEKIFG